MGYTVSSALGSRSETVTCERVLLRVADAFERDERAVLKPLPATAFERPTWAELKVHPDHHVVFERSYYSVPTRFVGRTVWVKGTRQFGLSHKICHYNGKHRCDPCNATVSPAILSKRT